VGLGLESFDGPLRVLIDLWGPLAWVCASVCEIWVPTSFYCVVGVGLSENPVLRICAREVKSREWLVMHVMSLMTAATRLRCGE
jgi:hypothetical protein